VDIETRESKIIVDVVQQLDQDEGFPGLYCDAIQEGCWIDADTLLLDSVWRSVKVTPRHSFILFCVLICHLLRHWSPFVFQQEK
jgi:hypothetical protein